MFAILTAFSIYSSIFPCTTHTSYAAVTEGDNVTDEMEESQKVELSLNYSVRKIIYGTCSYLSDFEVYNASGVQIDPVEAEWMSSDESVATVARERQQGAYATIESRHRHRTDAAAGRRRISFGIQRLFAV